MCVKPDLSHGLNVFERNMMILFGIRRSKRRLDRNVIAGNVIFRSSVLKLLGSKTKDYGRNM
jgi:hypothetical protein